MGKAQVRRDTESCLEPDTEGGGPPPRQGAVRTRYAFIQPRISNSDDPATQRVMFLQDDVGQYHCVDGVQSGWQSRSSAGFEPTAKVPGREVPTPAAEPTPAAVGRRSRQWTPTCSSKSTSSAWPPLTSPCSPMADLSGSVDVPVDGPSLYVAARVTGPATRLPVSWRVELRDEQGRVLTVQPYGQVGTKPAKELTFELQSCADIEKRRAENEPKPLTRPTSDDAGLSTCLQMVRENDEQTLDLETRPEPRSLCPPRPSGVLCSATAATTWAAASTPGRRSAPPPGVTAPPPAESCSPGR